MNYSHDEQFSKFVRNAITPVSGQELPRDLWPQMYQRLHEPGIHVPWFDWVLAALALILCLSFPGAIPALFYNL